MYAVVVILAANNNKSVVTKVSHMLYELWDRVTVAVGENKIGEQSAKLHNLKTCGKEVSDFEHSGGCVAFRKSSWEKVGVIPSG